MKKVFVLWASFLFGATATASPDSYFLDVLKDRKVVDYCVSDNACMGRETDNFTSAYMVDSNYIKGIFTVDMTKKWDDAIRECASISKDLIRKSRRGQYNDQINDAIDRYKEDPEWNKLKSIEYYDKYAQLSYGVYDSYGFGFGIYSVKGDPNGPKPTKNDYYMIICVYDRV